MDLASADVEGYRVMKEKDIGVWINNKTINKWEINKTRWLTNGALSTRSGDGGLGAVENM